MPLASSTAAQGFHRGTERVIGRSAEVDDDTVGPGDAGTGRRVAQPGQPGDSDAGLTGPAEQFVLGAVGQPQHRVKSGPEAAGGDSAPG